MADTDPLAPLEPWMKDLLRAAGPSARRRLADRIAKDLQASQRERIAAQLNPDGSAFARRKHVLRTKTGRIKRRQAMFAKLRTARYLKARATADKAEVGYTSRAAAIARVHQLGLRDRPQFPGPLVRYRKRELLGFTAEDRARIAETVFDSVDGAVSR